MARARRSTPGLAARGRVSSGVECWNAIRAMARIGPEPLAALNDDPESIIFSLFANAGLRETV
jgi:hypothetical protein